MKRSEGLLGLVKGIQPIPLQYEPDLKLTPYTPGLWNGNATDIAVEFVNLQQGGRRLSVGAASDIMRLSRPVAQGRHCQESQVAAINRF